MSVDPEDAYAEYAREIYEAHLAEEIIAEFSAERLASYYTARGVDFRPRDAFRRARTLLDVDPTASFLFAAIATEALLRSVLVKPLLYGLVHSESAADLILTLVVKENRGMSEFYKLLRQVLLDLVKVDLENHRRGRKLPTLWTEYQETARKRNRVVHDAVRVEKSDAESAISQYTAWGAIADKVVETLKLHVNGKTGQVTAFMIPRHRKFTYTEP